jgi:hypothetical protein
VDIMQRIEASANTGRPCGIALAEVVSFLRQVTAPPAGAASIEAVDFVHWLVSERGCRLDVPTATGESVTENTAFTTRPSSSASGS